MGRAVKLLGLLLGAVVVLFLLVGVAVSLLFDPNDYKDQIAQAVEERTGRNLTLDGDLELKVFPWLKIGVGPAALSNAPGFGEASFASIQGAALSLKVLPLLSGKVAIGEASLSGLALNLARNAAGVTNWEDLGGTRGQPAEAPAEPAAGGGIDLDVGSISVTDATLTWRDATTDQNFSLTDLNFKAAGLGGSASFPLSLDFQFAGDDLLAAVAAAGKTRMNLADNTYQLDNFNVVISGEGSAWPAGEGPVRLDFEQLAADLEAQTLTLNGLELALLGFTVNGNLTGSQIIDAMRVSGNVVLDMPDPKATLAALGVVLETADPQVLNAISGNAQLSVTANESMLENVSIQLDDSTLSGSLGMRGETLAFDLVVDQINLDRYLPPASEQAEAEADTGSMDEVDLPLDVIKDLLADGRFRVGQARLSGMRFDDVDLKLTAADGRLRLIPQSGLYGGRYSGDIRIKAQGNAAALSLDERIESVDLNPLGLDLYGVDRVSGRAEGRFTLSAVGSNLGEMRRALNGNLAFVLADGAWEGVDLWYEVRKARALFNKGEAPAAPEGPPRTPFSDVSATAVVKNGVLNNQDLKARMPFLAVTGAGTVDLVAQQMDYDLVATVLEKPEIAQDAAMADLSGRRLPLTIKGPIADPSIGVDFAALVKEEAKSKLKDKLSERLGLGGDEQTPGTQDEAEKEDPKDLLRKKLKKLF